MFECVCVYNMYIIFSIFKTVLPPSNCDKHLNITTTDVDDDNIDKNLYENITTADVDDNDNIYDDVKNII